MLVLIMVVTGCGSTADIHFDKYENAIITYEYYMTEKEYKANFVDGDLHVYTFDRSEITRNTPYTKTTRDGKTYYVYTFHYKEPVGNGYTFLDVRKHRHRSCSGDVLLYSMIFTRAPAPKSPARP